MAQKELTLVRNVTKRNFNGVRPYQIVSVLEENLFMYLNAGFEVYNPEANGDSPDVLGDDTGVQAPKPEDLSPEEIAERKKFLNDK